MYMHIYVCIYTIYPVIQNIGFIFMLFSASQSATRKQIQATRAIKHCSCIFIMFTEQYLIKFSQFVIQSHDNSLISLFFFIYIKLFPVLN